jgi:hypothetical protein
MDGRDDVRWGPRVPRHKIRRLYEAYVSGIEDEDLIDDVGITLLVRCRNILDIHAAKQGQVRCPRCQRRHIETVIERDRSTSADPRDEVLTCPTCDWTITWGAYAGTYKRKQLNPGGAVSAFRAYVAAYEAAHTPRAKMLAIDRLIHEFHYSLKQRPELPTRPVAVNLIQGKMTVVEAFLDDLAYGDGADAQLRTNRRVWRENLAARDRWLDEYRSKGS